jgi:UPF0716 family protein affecting phage T7 exclusion
MRQEAIRAVSESHSDPHRMGAFLLATCVLVILDFTFLGGVLYAMGWEIPLVETLVAGVIGLAVLVYYVCRWSEKVAQRIECEGLLDRWSAEKMLLLVAGLLLLIPGAFTDFVALLLLVPGMRRMLINLCQLVV